MAVQESAFSMKTVMLFGVMSAMLNSLQKSHLYINIYYYKIRKSERLKESAVTSTVESIADIWLNFEITSMEGFMQKQIVHTKTLEVHSIHDTHEFEDLKSEWSALFTESNCNEAFLSWEWLFAWWSYHKAGKHLWIVTVRQNGKLVGIAPFMLLKMEKYKLTFRVLTNLGEPDNDISGFIACENSSDVIEAIYNHLLTQRNQWDLLNIHELYVQDKKTQTFVSVVLKRRSSILQRIENHFYLPTNTNWDLYFEKLPHPLTGYLHHHIDKAKKSGEIRFEAFTGDALTWEHVETLLELGKKSRYAYLYQPENEKLFIRKLFELSHGQGLEIGFLYLNEKPVAFNFGFNFDGRHEGWRRAYDQSYGKIGVGKIMSKYMTKSFFDRNFREFDFLRGLEEYKREWEPFEREYMELRVVPNLKIIPALTFIWLPKLKAWWRKHRPKSSNQSQ